MYVPTLEGERIILGITSISVTGIIRRADTLIEVVRYTVVMMVLAKILCKPDDGPAYKIKWNIARGAKCPL
jgi:hypothetical protein